MKKEIKKGYFVLTYDGDVGEVLEIENDMIYANFGLITLQDIEECSDVLNDLVHEHDFINGARVYKSKTGQLLSHNGGLVSQSEIIQFITAKKFYRECYSPIKTKGVKWKVCENFEDYEVSDTGVVREVHTHKYISTLKRKNHLYVKLKDVTGSLTNVTVASLVLEAFVEPPNNRIPIYINGDVHDARLSNLKWGELPDKKKYNKQKKDVYATEYVDYNIDEIRKKSSVNVVIERAKRNKALNIEEPSIEDLQEIERDNFKRKLMKMLKEKNKE